MLIRAALPAVTLASVLIAGPMLREYALPLGFLLGNAVVFALMAREARYRYVPRVTIRKEWERKVFASAGVVMSTGLIARARPMIRNYLASLLGPGAIAALGLANRLVEPLERTAFTGLKMLMFSRSVKLFVAQDAKSLGRLYETGLAVTFLLMAPMVWWIALNNDLLVRLLFMRGAFGPEMSAMVSLALLGLIPSVVLAGVNQMMSNAFYATGRVVVPAVVMPLGTLAYAAVAPALMGAFAILGLAVAISVAAAVDFVLLALWLPKQVESFSIAKTARAIALYVVASGASFTAAKIVLADLGVGGVVHAGIALVAGGAVYLGLLWIARDANLGVLLRYARIRGRPHSQATSAG
jgi:putative peptidoglycan lipid II flippase